MKRVAILTLFGMALPMGALACEGPVAVCEGVSVTDFALIKGGKPATVYVAADAPKPVLRVADDFADDLERVSGVRPAVVHDLKGASGDVVIIAEAGHSPLSVEESGVEGKWEAYAQTVISRPEGGKALVIVGADPRGAIYGTYDISAKMGVSPWYWWADVPVVKKSDLYVTAGYLSDAPKVKYRGFFINDEEPSFGGWGREKFGGINHDLYGHVFELELRLKGNYLWPAMWGKAFADDDPLNQQTAADYGIVMGTSHHEPMTRAQDEWHRHADGGVTGGKWDYTTNAANLRTFWRGGIERMQAGGFENVVTIGMRGDGDEPMSEGTATHLLEGIVADQRQIIADVTGKPVDETPQVWALYKEVQDYYDHGMKVPDDVTLLFSDDNWGQIRRLPDLGADPGKVRAGGYGVYYHFDYVGGPRNYKWLNSSQIEKTWQQMDLAWESGADRLWIVNVGDIKPLEFPLSFFMDMAWNPAAMTPQALQSYPAKWAGQQFGEAHAAEIGEILTRYSQYNARRKPELLDALTFSLDSYNEFGDAYLQYDLLDRATEAQQAKLPDVAQSSFFQLVQYPVFAGANLYDLYLTVARNRDFADQNDALANEMAAVAKSAFIEDQALSDKYNALSDGKWRHMMDQTHIGYTGWQQPDTQVMPQIVTLSNPKPSLKPKYGKLSWSVAKTFDGTGRAMEDDGYIAIEAEHYSRKIDGKGVHWQVIPNLGRTLSSVISMPQTAAPTTDNVMRLEYDIETTRTADATLNLYLAPTLDTRGAGGVRFAVSIDDRPPQTLTFNLKPETPEWNQAVSDNIVILKAPFKNLKAGRHTIRVFRIDGNVVLERLVLDTGGIKPSFLGPPESAGTN